MEILVKAVINTRLQLSVRNLPAMQETRVQSLGGGDPLEKEMATNSSILAWRFMDRRAWQATVHGVARVRHDLATKPPCDINSLQVSHLIVTVLQEKNEFLLHLRSVSFTLTFVSHCFVH